MAISKLYFYPHPFQFLLHRFRSTKKSSFILQKATVASNSRISHERLCYIQSIDDGNNICDFKQLWSKILQNQALRVITYSKLGFSRCRLVPKNTGIRFIVNMSGNATHPKISQKFKAKNKVLRSVFEVLKFEIVSVLFIFTMFVYNEQSKSPQILGATVLGSNQFYVKYSKFVHEWKTRCIKEGREIPLYFVSVDVKNCFDSILRELMLELAEKLFKSVKQCADIQFF